MTKFTERLEELKNKNNVSNQQLADMLGVKIRVVQYYCNGNTTPPLDKIIALANYFDVSIDYLVGRTNDPESHKK